MHLIYFCTKLCVSLYVCVYKRNYTKCNNNNNDNNEDNDEQQHQKRDVKNKTKYNLSHTREKHEYLIQFSVGDDVCSLLGIFIFLSALPLNFVQLSAENEKGWGKVMESQTNPNFLPKGIKFCLNAFKSLFERSQAKTNNFNYFY